MQWIGTIGNDLVWIGVAAAFFVAAGLSFARLDEARNERGR